MMLEHLGEKAAAGRSHAGDRAGDRGPDRCTRPTSAARATTRQVTDAKFSRRSAAKIGKTAAAGQSRVSGDPSVIARSPCDEAIQGPQHARRQQPRRSYCGPWIASLRSQ